MVMECSTSNAYRPKSIRILVPEIPDGTCTSRELGASGWISEITCMSLVLNFVLHLVINQYISVNI